MGVPQPQHVGVRRNAWFHDWLVENDIDDAFGAYNAAKDSALLADLVRRAQGQEKEPSGPLGGYSIMAGRSLDLTEYMACGHPACMTKQVDTLFHHVWHYFDKIAVSGPETHAFLHAIESWPLESIADKIASLSRPIFHIREIGAEGLVEWISKPPPCVVHWLEYSSIKEYQIPRKLAKSMASALLEEGTIESDEHSNSGPQLRINHPDLYEGFATQSIEYLQGIKRPRETIEHALARSVVEAHWLGTATDLYSASLVKLPIGMGLGLEARMATSRRDSIMPAEVAFNLVLPIVDGLPVKELLALRESEGDAFEGFRDSLTAAIREQLSAADREADNPGDLARELQVDIIDPALHRIQRRLHAAEGVLRKNHRYNIAMAGLATLCGIFTSADIAAAIAAAALTGTGVVEYQYTSERRDIALEDMYFLWTAQERAEQQAKKVRRR
jgi:hypothetical protein